MDLEVFWAPDGLPDQNLRMTEIGCLKGNLKDLRVYASSTVYGRYGHSIAGDEQCVNSLLVSTLFADGTSNRLRWRDIFIFFKNQENSFKARCSSILIHFFYNSHYPKYMCNAYLINWLEKFSCSKFESHTKPDPRFCFLWNCSYKKKRV